MTLRYLVTGTGRCGTAYITRMLTKAGIPCDHEQVFSAGGIREDRHYLGGATSSWLAVPFLESNPGLIGPETTLIHLIRHPKDFIESVLRLRIFSPDCPPNYMPYRDFILRNMPSIQMERDVDAAATFGLGGTTGSKISTRALQPWSRGELSTLRKRYWMLLIWRGTSGTLIGPQTPGNGGPKALSQDR